MSSSGGKRPAIGLTEQSSAAVTHCRENFRLASRQAITMPRRWAEAAICRTPVRPLQRALDGERRLLDASDDPRS